MARAAYASVVEVAGGAVLGRTSVYGNITVGTVASEVKVGDSPLLFRHSVFLNASPDNSGNIYIGLDDTVTEDNAMLCLPPSGAFAIDLDKDDTVRLYAISLDAGQKLHIGEIK